LSRRFLFFEIFLTCEGSIPSQFFSHVSVATPPTPPGVFSQDSCRGPKTVGTSSFLTVLFAFGSASHPGDWFFEDFLPCTFNPVTAPLYFHPLFSGPCFLGVVGMRGHPSRLGPFPLASRPPGPCQIRALLSVTEVPLACLYWIQTTGPLSTRISWLSCFFLFFPPLHNFLPLKWIPPPPRTSIDHLFFGFIFQGDHT